LNTATTADWLEPYLEKVFPVATAWVPIKKDHIPSTALKGSTSLPDFGKTSVEVDKIRLEPNRRNGGVKICLYKATQGVG
jgi:hypothetical protein